MLKSTFPLPDTDLSDIPLCPVSFVSFKNMLMAHLACSLSMNILPIHFWQVWYYSELPATCFICWFELKYILSKYTPGIQILVQVITKQQCRNILALPKRKNKNKQLMLLWAYFLLFVHHIDWSNLNNKSSASTASYSNILFQSGRVWLEEAAAGPPHREQSNNVWHQTWLGQTQHERRNWVEVGSKQLWDA